MSNVIERKFYYYGSRAYYVVGSDEKQVPNYSLAIRNVFKDIAKLKYSNRLFDQQHLLYKKNDGTYIYIVVDDSVDLDTCSSIRFQLIQCRDNLLPCIEEKGKLTPLKDFLKGRNQKLAEITHCVLFLDKRVLAMEYNYAGAKKPELVSYLFDKIDKSKVSRISFESLLNSKTINKLSDDGEMSLLRIKVRRGSNVAKKLAEKDDVFKALAVKNEGIDYVEVVLRAHTTKNKKGFKIPNFNMKLIKDILSKHKEDIDDLKVKYGRGTDLIDLLDENYVCKEGFVPIDRTKLIKSEEAYKKMEDYYYKMVLPEMKG